MVMVNEIIPSENDLRRKATQIRMDLLSMIYQAKTGHTGSSLCNTDILTALYYGVLRVDSNYPTWPQRDRFILSKGHAVESYYCILADLGFFPKEELKMYSQFGSRLIGHPNNKVPGVEMNTGSLGHGLSVGVGMALASRMDAMPVRVFVLMGDGEQAEGSVWEAAMAAAHYRLDNLTAIIDRNRLQISGRTDDVMQSEPLDEKWKSFGWHVESINGHDLEQMTSMFRKVPLSSGKPTLFLANTTKGKGVSFAENVPQWHHHVPTEEELHRAMEELQREMEGISR